MTVIYVGVGGVLSVLARCGISYPFHGDALPWATVAINVLGSFLLGALRLIYLGASVVLGIAAATLGYACGRSRCTLDAAAGSERLARLSSHL